jgi:hypothetical protein
MHKSRNALRKLLVAISFLVLVTLIFWAGSLVASLSDQVADGEDLYKDNCSSCHGKDLGGKSAPILIGTDFTSSLSSKGMDNGGQLYEFVKTKMPLHRPGALSSDEYLSITVYILWQNGIDLGSQMEVDDLYGIQLP